MKDRISWLKTWREELIRAVASSNRDHESFAELPPAVVRVRTGLIDHDQLLEPEAPTTT
jgi:hypothetical protein